jgi:hypothetical protein
VPFFLLVAAGGVSVVLWVNLTFAEGVAVRVLVRVGIGVILPPFSGRHCANPIPPTVRNPKILPAGLNPARGRRLRAGLRPEGRIWRIPHGRGYRTIIPMLSGKNMDNLIQILTNFSPFWSFYTFFALYINWP